MITNPFTRMVLFGVPEEIYLGTNGALIRNKDRVTNANEEGCNQYTGPNCGGRVRYESDSTPTSRGTRMRGVYEDYGYTALVDSNGDVIYHKLHPSEEAATEDAIKIAKFHKLGINKPRFKETGYFKDRRGVVLQKGASSFELGDEETGDENFQSVTHLHPGHLQRLLEKIRSKRGA